MHLHGIAGSEGQGQRMRFREARASLVELGQSPTGDSSDPPHLYASEQQETASTRPGRVLIVEDEYFIMDQIERTLLDAGYDVVAAVATAEEAIEIAETERPDVAVMDIRLAGERDGIDAAAELLERWGIQSIFATAHDDPATRHRAEAANPAGWLTKPLSPRRLIDSVYRAMAISRDPDS